MKSQTILIPSHHVLTFVMAPSCQIQTHSRPFGICGLCSKPSFWYHELTRKGLYQNVFLMHKVYITLVNIRNKTWLMGVRK